MKSYSYILLAPALVGLFLATGCSKPEEMSTTPADLPPRREMPKPEVQATTQAVTTAVQQASAQVQTQAAAVQATAQKAATDAQAQAANLTSKTQSVIDSIKSLLAQKKWSEALKALNDLAATKLTPEQQATVDALKQQAVKLGQEAASSKVAEQGGKAVNDLLPKK